MAKLVCADYGYDCEFVVEGEPDQVAEKFRIHTEEEHGIDYSKETLTKFMLDNNY
jgi:predicted small metal-binding protein